MLLTEEHFKAIVDKLGDNDCTRLYHHLEGLDFAAISKSKKGSDPPVNVEKEATDVFRAWIKLKGSDATRQVILTALEDCNNNLAKENLNDMWGKGTLIHVYQ